MMDSRLTKFPPVKPTQLPDDFWSYDQSLGEIRRWVRHGIRMRNGQPVPAIRSAHLWELNNDGTVLFDLVYSQPGYSGYKRGLNNPKLQGEQGVGPIPQGWWYMRDIYDSPKVGKRTITLWSLEDSIFDDRYDWEMNGVKLFRSAFRIHGDNVRKDFSASRGCIIAQRDVRMRMWNSGIPFLRVVE